MKVFKEAPIISRDDSKRNNIVVWGEHIFVDNYDSVCVKKEKEKDDCDSTPVVMPML